MNYLRLLQYRSQKVIFFKRIITAHNFEKGRGFYVSFKRTMPFKGFNFEIRDFGQSCSGTNKNGATVISSNGFETYRVECGDIKDALYFYYKKNHILRGENDE